MSFSTRLFTYIIENSVLKIEIITLNIFTLELVSLSATLNESIISSVSVRYVVPMIAFSVKVNAVYVGTLTSNDETINEAVSSGSGS